jgi:hypothetical protein
MLTRVGTSAHSAQVPARLTRQQHDLAPCAACHIWHCQACGCVRGLARTGAPPRP